MSDRAQGTLPDSQRHTLDLIPAVVNWIVPWSLDEVQVGSVAVVAGWIQDSMIITMFAVLIVSGAKLTTDKRRSKVEIQKPSPEVKKAASAGLSGLRL